MSRVHAFTAESAKSDRRFLSRLTLAEVPSPEPQLSVPDGAITASRQNGIYDFTTTHRSVPCLYIDQKCFTQRGRSSDTTSSGRLVNPIPSNIEL